MFEGLPYSKVVNIEGDNKDLNNFNLKCAMIKIIESKKKILKTGICCVYIKIRVAFIYSSFIKTNFEIFIFEFISHVFTCLRVASIADNPRLAASTLLSWPQICANISMSHTHSHTYTDACVASANANNSKHSHTHHSHVCLEKVQIFTHNKVLDSEWNCLNMQTCAGHLKSKQQ